MARKWNNVCVGDSNQPVVRLPDRVVYLLTGLNADQYVAEMRVQLAR